jgi:DNA helicase-2/ATP-dependent DNA helicase PcrA
LNFLKVKPLTVPIALFEEFPEILEKYRRRYRYLMADEF